MIFTLVFFVVVIFIAYKIGDRSGLAGVMFFLVAFVLHQSFKYGPESILNPECSVEWDERSNSESC